MAYAQGTLVGNRSRGVVKTFRRSVTVGALRGLALFQLSAGVLALACAGYFLWWPNRAALKGPEQAAGVMFLTLFGLGFSSLGGILWAVTRIAYRSK